MFKFFNGTVDELLNAVATAPETEIARIKDDNTVLITVTNLSQR